MKLRATWVADSSRHFLLSVLSECTEFLSSTFIVIDVSEHQGGLMTVDVRSAEEAQRITQSMAPRPRRYA